RHVVVGADDAVLDGFVIEGGYAMRGVGGGGPGMSPPGARGDLRRGGAGPRPGRRPGPAPGRQGMRRAAAGAVPEGGGRGAIHTTPQAILAGPPPTAGAGLLNYQAAPTVRHCVFRNNHAGKGGAVYNLTARGFPPGRGASAGGPTPVFEDCVFENNHARGRGGAVSNDLGASPVFRRCRFLGNTCDQKGGGMYNDFGCSPLLVQCLFVGNRAWQAGAMGNDGGSSPFLLNCTFTRNEAGDAGAALYQGTGTPNNPVLRHCILWDDRCAHGPAELYNWHESMPLVSHSCVQGGWPGEGNLDADPRFRDPGAGDFSPAPDSPCPQAGWTVLAEPEPTLWPPPAERRPPFRPPETATAPDQRLPAQAVVRVRAGATAANPDGRSWATAFSDLQAAIDHAWRCGGEVWIAGGTYRPAATQPGDRSASFRLRPGVALYGGFAGTETQREQRDWTAHPTVLSGDLGRPGEVADNAFHVVIGAEGARLDGLTITGGCADGWGYDGKGGGLITYPRGVYVPPRGPRTGWTVAVAHCRFLGNRAREGGAVYDFDRSSPRYEDCVFEANEAGFGGAAVLRVGVEAVFDRCRFTGNRAHWRGGALHLDYGSRVRFVGCSFEDNQSAHHGGAIHACSRASQLENTVAVLEQCRFVANVAGARGGAVAADDASLLELRGCRFERNRAGEGGGAVAADRRAEVTLTACVLEPASGPDGMNDVVAGPEGRLLGR
ncbi:MAG: hypothetical protein D6766_08010, partial [Verrucomicrobia bacterium]